MTFSEIFEQSMRALAQGDRKRMEELGKLQEEKIKAIREQKRGTTK